VSDSINITCPNCSARNRLSENRLDDNPICGQCKKELFDARPVDLNKTAFDRNLAHNSIPLARILHEGNEDQGRYGKQG